MKLGCCFKKSNNNVNNLERVIKDEETIFPVTQAMEDPVRPALTTLSILQETPIKGSLTEAQKKELLLSRYGALPSRGLTRSPKLRDINKEAEKGTLLR